MNLRHRNIDPTPERLTRAAEHARWLADVINTTPERYAWLALREGKSCDGPGSPVKPSRAPEVPPPPFRRSQALPGASERLL